MYLPYFHKMNYTDMIKTFEKIFIAIVIYSFIKNAKLKNKTVVPFCTSDNSEISPSDQNLANFAPEDVYFMTGKRFTKDSSIEEIKDWATIISTDLDVR